MGEVASSYVSIYPQFAPGFKREIAKQVGDGGEAGGVGLAAGIGRGTKQGMGKVAGVVKGGLLGIVASVGVGATVGVFNDLTEGASDLNETLGKAKSTFGDSFGALDRWSTTAAKSLGMSRSEALTAASGFGDMFTQLKFTGDQAAEMSQKVVQMSADLGAYNNLDTADVSDRIAAAFRGEYDSLQKVIPGINAARVEKEALALSGKENAKALTAQEKAQAVLNIVQSDGAKAMGNYAATADEVAQKQKTAAAQAKDLQDRFGTMLLPVKQLALDGFGKLLDAGTEMTDWLERNPEVMEGVTAAFELMGGALGGVATVVGAVALPALAILTEGFSQVVGGFAGMLRALGTVPGFEWASQAADKLDKVKDGAHALAGGLEKLTYKAWGVTVVSTADRKPIRDLEAQLAALKDKEVTATAKGDTKGAAQVRAEMAALQNKIVTVRLQADLSDFRARTQAALNANPLRQPVTTAGAAVYRAEGAVVDYYGRGGIRERHVAEIAPAGAWRVWAEPETGGESYIPLAPSKRARSLDIWRETGRRLGVAGFADGGVRGGADSGRADLASELRAALEGAVLTLTGADYLANSVAARLSIAHARGV